MSMCPECRGSGVIEDDIDDEDNCYEKECDVCGGSGELDDD